MFFQRIGDKFFEEYMVYEYSKCKNDYIFQYLFDILLYFVLEMSLNHVEEPGILQK